MDPVRRLKSYLGAYKGMLIAGLLCTALVQGISLYNTYLAKQVLGSAESKSLDLLNFYAKTVIGIYILKGVFSYGQLYLISKVAQRISTTLRNQIYEHLQSLSMSFFDTRKTGQLMSTITNDVPVLQTVMTTGIIEGVGAPLMVLGGTAYIFWINWKLALVTVFCLPVMAHFINSTGQRMRKASALIQLKLADISTILEETLAAMRIIKSFAMESYESRRFTDESQRAFRASMRGVKIKAVLSPVIELIGAGGITFVIWFGGQQIAQGKLTIPELMQFTLLVNQIAAAARQIGNINYGLQQIRAAGERIFELLDVESEIQELPDAIALSDVKGNVDFQNATFGYNPERPVLREVSFSVRPGEMIALVGPTGAGKSTVANLIPRFYDIQDGAVMVDGHDIRTLKLNDLRRQIAIVPQETVLFCGTIRENIAYGRIGALDSEIEAAAMDANAHGFISSFPEGYETLVGERGVTLSGGQRQRIAIARAILKDSPILILDEATSSLDAESESLVQEALERLMRNRTTIVIAHRLSTIRNADRILVLERGRVVQQGNHAQLMAADGLYAKLYEVQLEGLARGMAPADAPPGLA